MTALLLPASAHAQDAKQQLLERVFGDAVRLDPIAVAEVKALKPGEQLFLDTGGDGKTDECWYIDISPRHQAKARPLLVRVIDEDGDMDEHKGPDLDSDLYVGDWNADGTADVVIDYTDTDGDGDVDEMGVYYWSPKDHFLGRDALRCWWSRDDGDDNLLWYDVNLTYQQAESQWRTHFSGDETFVAFGLTAGSDHWISIWENPFLFYDPDGDECSEVVARFSGLADEVEALRYSFDADDDAHGRRTHDYDFSITAIAPGSRFTRGDNKPGSDIKIPAELTESITLRGIPTGGWLRREHALKFAAEAPWARALLTWDEIDSNTDGNVARDLHERWEGVIARGSEKFPQVGGPPASALNKRNELALRPQTPLALYWNPAELRVHLAGATEGWLHVDFDLDGRIDAEYRWIDDDGDGRFDRREIDVDADGTVDFDWPVRNVTDLALNWSQISGVFNRTLVRRVEANTTFTDAARLALNGEMGLAGPVEAFFVSMLKSPEPPAGLGSNVSRSPAGARYYTDLICDRLLYELKRRYGQESVWKRVEDACATGGREKAARLILEHFAGGAKPASPEWFGRFAKRIPILISSHAGPHRRHQPISIRVQDLKAVAPDFNPDHCAVVLPERWIVPREAPHQSGVIEPERGPELTFLADMPSGLTANGDAPPAMTPWYVYYSPEGTREQSWPARTATAEDWVPPNIGWESGRCAYRAYWGQFDFFGKSSDHLIYPTIGATSYHAETEWGIDALLVGKTSGLGGLTLYHEGKAYPVQNPAGQGNVKFEKRVLAAGPVRAAVEITASNIIPDKPEATVRMVCIIYAEHQETEIRVQVTGLEGEALLAPGFIKLAREKVFIDPEHGIFGDWGFQDKAIGDIGMGLIFDPKAWRDTADLPDEHRIMLTPSDGGRLRYWLIGDWQRGRRFPIAPTATNWHTELRGLAQELLQEPKVTIGSPEERPE